MKVGTVELSQPLCSSNMDALHFKTVQRVLVSDRNIHTLRQAGKLTVKGDFISVMLFCKTAMEKDS